MPDLPDLIPLDDAQRRVLGDVDPLPAAIVDLADAAGLVLAEPVRSALTVPPWANSAMDGFAVRAADVAAAGPGAPVVLPVLGEVPAGRAPNLEVAPGTTLRIMTGAMVPPGADAVVPVEDTDAPAGESEIPEAVEVRVAAGPGANLRLAGTDVAEGALLLEPGRALDPAAIALLAATGHASAAVHRRPRVAVISTGDELVPPGGPLGPAQIHDSNSLALAAQAADAGAEVRRLGIARDTLPDLLAIVREGMAWADVVVMSGGVSVGAHDHVKAAFSDLGTLHLWRVAIKPGRPFAFASAVVDGRPVRLFGLPGNPVSVFVTFELFVRPVLRLLAGHTRAFGRPERSARLAEPMRGSAGRLTVARVVLAPDPDRPDGLLARSSGGQGSHMIFSLAVANGLLFIPPDVDLPAGADAVAWELRPRRLRSLAGPGGRPASGAVPAQGLPISARARRSEAPRQDARGEARGQAEQVVDDVGALAAPGEGRRQQLRDLDREREDDCREEHDRRPARAGQERDRQAQRCHEQDVEARVVQRPEQAQRRKAEPREVARSGAESAEIEGASHRGQGGRQDDPQRHDQQRRDRAMGAKHPADPPADEQGDHDRDRRPGDEPRQDRRVARDQVRLVGAFEGRAPHHDGCPPACRSARDPNSGADGPPRRAMRDVRRPAVDVRCPPRGQALSSLPR